jgi:chlorophyll/bacteriochlorophyll a synthase
VGATSQAGNDWFDRHVDAINEPNRPIPSGRVPGRWGLYIALIWTAFSLELASTLGVWGFGAGVFGLTLAWAYSAPPIRLKRNGWLGNAAVGLCYEGLPWFTASAIMAQGPPGWQIVLVALLYSIGAHGIMTLNDFKSIDGDRATGIRSLPVQLGPERAAGLACITMALAQAGVITLLFAWHRPLHGSTVVLSLLKAPREMAPWYNGTGVALYVLGMMVAAFALAGLEA